MKVVVGIDEIEVVIKIPKKKYDVLMETADCSLNHNERAIKHGTVLPKGHGALKDADKIVMESNVDMWTDSGYESMVAVEDINNAPTIIEADKAVDNG